jgi:hypothetical protein
MTKIRKGTFRERSRNIQRTFREHSGNVQCTFSAHSGNIQGAFTAHFGTRHPRQTPLRHEKSPLRMPQNFAHLFGVLFWIYFRLYLLRQSIWPYRCGVWKGKKGAFGVHAKMRQHE